MRRFLLLLTLVLGSALAATSSASAALARTPGSEDFSLRNGTGTAVISHRGAMLGRLRRGRLTVTDLPSAGSPTVIVRGQEGKVIRGATTVYRGRNLTFRVFGGSWRARIRGRGIYVSGVVRGWLRLVGTSGTYAVGDGDYESWPTSLEVIKLAS